MDPLTLPQFGLASLPVGAASLGAIVGGILGGWALSAGLAAWRRMAGVLAASLGGLGVSLYLGRQHHPSTPPSICNVDDVFNCDAVNSSAWSEVAGVPIAFLGAGFYAATAAVAALSLSGRPGHARAAHGVFGGAVVAVLYSAFLAFQSMQMGAWCLFCISLYGINLILLGAAGAEARAAGVPLLDGVKEAYFGKDDKSVGVMSTVGAVALIGAMVWYRGLGPAAPPTAAGGQVDYAAMYQMLPAAVELDGSEPVEGNPAAPYTVVEFADFQCPACARIADGMKELPKALPEVRVLFKHYPLSNVCNPLIDSAFHEHACGAAAAADCAGKQGKFWELNRLMFLNQQYLSPPDLQTMAAQIGLDLPAWSACLADPGTMAGISADVQAANAVGISGTPSVFLRGIAGDRWVKVPGGPGDVKVLVEAHKSGKLSVGG